MATLTEHLCSLPTPTPYDTAVSHPFLVSPPTVLPSTSSKTASTPPRPTRASSPNSSPRPRSTTRYTPRLKRAHSPSSSDASPTSSAKSPFSTPPHARTISPWTTATGASAKPRATTPPRWPGSARSRLSRTFSSSCGPWKRSARRRMQSFEPAERCQWQIYLDAWSAVYAALPKPSPFQVLEEVQSQADLTAQAITDLSYNWSSANSGFAEFVQVIGDLVDDYFIPVMAGQPLAGRSAREVLTHAETIWARVVELEADFWPNDGEEDTLRVRTETEG